MNDARRIILGVALCLFAAHGMSWAGDGGGETATQEQIELYARAGEAFQNGDYFAVVDLLGSLVEEGEAPHSYACILFGAACMHSEDTPRAVGAFRKGVSVYPGNAQLHLHLGVALSMAEEYGEAADVFTIASRLDSENSARHLYAAAQCRYSAEDYSASLDILRGILDTADARPDWINLAAVNAIQLSLWEDAESYAERLIALEPEERVHWKKLAYVRMQLEKHQLAAAAMDIAARLPGTTETDRRQLSGLYRSVTAPILSLEIEKLLPVDERQVDVSVNSLLRGNRLPRLVEYLDDLPGEEMTVDMYLIKGVACYRLGRLAGAQAAFRQGASLAGKDSGRCRMLEGLVAWERREWQAAKEAFGELAKDEDCAYARQAASSIASIEAMETLESELAELDAERK